MMDGFVKISFCGDIMCLKEQTSAAINADDQQEAFNSIFENVKTLFAESDYVVGNLETPVCDAEFSSESINFNTPVDFLVACKHAGFDFLTTANNHCLDRGINGITQTIENLDKLGIKHTGTYSSRDKSEDICIVDVKGAKVAFIAATFGTNSEVNGNILSKDDVWRVDLLKKQNKPAKAKFNPSGCEGKKTIYDNVSSAAITNGANQMYMDRLYDKIEKAKEAADIVIVMPHIGGQYNSVPGKYTRYVVSEISKRNPSLIVSGHPHVPLRLEKTNGVNCAYSLGNFTFTPNVGYYIPNLLADYGIVYHTYWNSENFSLARQSFSIVKNVVGQDGISRVWPASSLYAHLQTTIEKERLQYEAEAVAVRFLTALIDNPLANEIEIP